MPPPVPPASCVHCGKSIDAHDVCCRHCGRRQRTGDAWYYSTAWVAFLAFFVLGPLALVLVWKSTIMGAIAKKVLAALIVLYSLMSVYYFYRIIVLILGEMSKLDEVMRRF